MHVLAVHCDNTLILDFVSPVHFRVIPYEAQPGQQPRKVSRRTRARQTPLWTMIKGVQKWTHLPKCRRHPTKQQQLSSAKQLNQ